MGTRGLTVVIAGGKNVIAQYGQWDHYAGGQGLDALAFLRDADAVARLRENVSRIVVPTDAYTSMLTAMSESLEISTEKIAPQMSRNMGAGVLAYVANSTEEILYLWDSSDFVNDTLFCEGVFEVDLDKNTYRFYSPGYESDGFDGPTYPLDNLPDDDTFVKENSEEDEED